MIAHFWLIFPTRNVLFAYGLSYARKRLSVSAFIFTMPTTCSRPSIEMVGFIYLFIYFSVDGVLATPFDIFGSNFVCRFVRTV